MTTKPGKPALNTKQELFVLEFLKDLNATRAYKEVYKTTQSIAETNGPRLLGNAGVKAEIDKKLRERFARADKDGQRVIDRLFELVDRCMQRVPVMVYDKELKEHVQATNENGEGVWQFDSSGANTALTSLGKYFKLFVDRHQIEGDINVVIKKAQ